ncbi:N-terminal phage integrase SAM-like domain-containing protein [Prauserella flavalba]|uniref:N-terminal phage integrase SAM-like domain-containing protein n=1 Tax=Prauserella flavalba TaxID=1477506 RepID=UPI0036E41F71
MAIDEWLKTLEVEESTRETYEMYARRYLKPALGDKPIGKITARVLEQLYAELRRCRAGDGKRDPQARGGLLRQGERSPK